MQIEEHNSLVKLFDIYGELLSAKQKEVLDKHLNLDLGESELAELTGETRQSVHDALKKAKSQLYIMEDKCKILLSRESQKENLILVKNLLQENNLDKARHSLDEIIKNL